MTGSPAVRSAIYRGWVRHRRHRPHPHAFRYRIYLMYLDLAELPRVFERRRFWSIERPNLACFRRADYLGDASVPLDEAVRARAEEVLGRRPQGPIRMLTHLRTFGHCFNPVTFYFCFDPGDRELDCIVAEITNTPWKERHSYVLDGGAATVRGGVRQWGFAKRFHVSPFLPMQRDYCWRFETPSESLRIHMDVLGAGEPEFDATLVLKRVPITSRSLAACLLRYPAMTVRVVLAIHWQAFLIWCRRNPVYDHPTKSAKRAATGNRQ